MQRGDEGVEEFREIYLEYFDRVYRYVFSLCRDEGVAEEVTQEAFYRAMGHLEGFDGRCRLYVWLCQIAKNTLFSYMKKQKRFVQEGALEEGAAEGPEGEVLDREDVRRVLELLEGLGETYREVFSLRVFGELPFSQIGEAFGKSDGWARLVYYRAKNELRRKLDEDTV